MGQLLNSILMCA